MWLFLYLISFEIYLNINKNVKNKNGYNQFLEKNYNLMNRHYLHFRYKQHKLRVTCLKKT